MPRDEQYDRDYDRRQSGDLIVTPGDYVYILDETKGLVSVIVGPQKMSLAGTDKPVTYDRSSKRFVPSDPEKALQRFVNAPRGAYVELQNPASSNASSPHPHEGRVEGAIELQHGCKINIAGPVHCALWPGQVANVIGGHNLRSNQYLICRVYDDESAQANIDEAVIKTAEEGGGETREATSEERKNLLPARDELVTGKRFIIKGTDVSFFIPPNGIEVLPDSDGDYIRAAVTLEQLEYCILLDENGNKRFERGPQVVFPTPTERFVKRKPAEGEMKRSQPDRVRSSDTTRRFRAIELNDISGIYVKVTASYEENGRVYEEGEELFITGKEQRIYFPRAEHSIVKYGDRDIHYAVAIPAGDCKYVMDKDSGDIKLIDGPRMFLPDPRKEVIVRRILSEDKLHLWYPGNVEAQEYNANLRQAASGSSDGFVTDRQYRHSVNMAAEPTGALLASAGTAHAFDDDAVYANVDNFGRSAKYTKPMTITLDDKFDGAIKIQVWTGYAIQIINGVGERRVVTGPAVTHLAYDEELESFFVSTGTPKNPNATKRDVYLRVLNNRVSDEVTVETSDMVRMDLTVSYRVDFTGDPNKWFNVENYVQHLCDNCRSILRNIAKTHNIESFYNDYINIVRNTLTPAEEGSRPGRLFEENGMLITEVEVLGCSIYDSEIRHMLEDSQRSAAATLIELNQGRKQYELDQEEATLQRKRAELETETMKFLEEQDRVRQDEMETTREQRHKLELENLEREQIREQARIKNTHEREELANAYERERTRQRDRAEVDRQEALDEVDKRALARDKARQSNELELMRLRTQDYIERLVAEAEKEAKVSEAVQPELVEALMALSKASMLKEVTKEIAPLAIVKGLSIGGAVQQLFEGTQFESAVGKLVQSVEANRTNGSGGVAHEEALQPRA